jgi:hypothetical protein
VVPLKTVGVGVVVASIFSMVDKVLVFALLAVVTILRVLAITGCDTMIGVLLDNKVGDGAESAKFFSITAMDNLGSAHAVEVTIPRVQELILSTTSQCTEVFDSN